MMERTPASFKRLPLLAFAGGTLAALLLLAEGGGSAADAFRLLTGMLPVTAGGESWFRLLLGRSCHTFAMVCLALLTGMSGALFFTVCLASWWQPLRLLAAALARLASNIPPMAWACGFLFLLVEIWHLPVESLFPSRPGSGADTLMMHAGRSLWSLLAPTLTLAVPVGGWALGAFLCRIGGFWKDPIILSLRARGCSSGMIVAHHLAPRLASHAIRIALPASGLLLLGAVPVEEIFMVEGWGGFMAEALSARQPLALAAGFYTAGGMLAVLLAVLCLVIRHTPVYSASDLHDQEPLPSLPAFAAAGALLLAVAGLSWWGAPDTWLAPALSLSFQETGRTLALALGASVVVMFAMYAPITLPLAFGLALLLPLPWQIFTLLGLTLAIPQVQRGRKQMHALRHSGFALAAWMLGSGHHAFWRRHGLRFLWPALLAGCLRMAALALWAGSLLTFYGYDIAPGAPSWGSLMREHAAEVLDAPLPILAPALCLGLWSLSFQALARVFAPGSPTLPTHFPSSRK